MASHAAQWEQRRVMIVLAGLVDEAWSVMEPNLAELSDEEYFWEPAPGCWGIRRRADVRSPDCWGRGEWVAETSLDGTAAPTMTTIGWRLMHAYDCTNDYVSKSFGQGALDWNDIDVPGNATAAVDLMTAAIGALRTHLSSESDDVLVDPADDALERPRWLLLDKAVLEAIHHCAEIGVLRQMFLQRASR